MKIQELEEKIFGNIQHQVADGVLINKYGLEFDGYIEPSEESATDGDRIECLITSDGEKIPLDDFIILDKDEFEAKYPFESAKQSFKNFRDKYVVLAGDEIITYYREQIKKLKEKDAQRQKFNIEDLSCGGF